MPLLFTIALVLSILCLAVSAEADFQVGVDAYNRGEYIIAGQEFKKVAEEG